MEDWKKKYEDLFARIKAMADVQPPVTKAAIESHFPELKESEDEKIRKALIEKIKTLADEESVNYQSDFYAGDYNSEQILAWLEKQGESSVCKIKIGETYKCIASPRYTCFRRGDVYNVTDNFVAELINISSDCFVLLEKQGEQETLCDKCKKEQPSHSCQDITALGRCALEKQSEKKPVDKVKPKFKVGDWVIDKQDLVHQIANVIENVTSHTYGYDIVGGGYFNDNTEGVRHWTIQDAKAGDVLIDNYNNVVMYQEPCSNLLYHSFCFASTKVFVDSGGSHFIEGTYPATKEQRDLLFQKMKEAGYEWNAEKKELKKVEQSLTWSEEDETGLGDALWAIQQARTIAKNENDMGNLWYAERWLKSLKDRVQPKQEWSEEDESMLEDIIFELEENQENISGVGYKIDWLKSLRPQNTWKPSDEQMEALYEETQKSDRIRDERIVSLYEQLKKLKG